MSQDNVKLSTPVHLQVKEGLKVIFEKSFDSLPITIGRSLQCEVPLSQYNWVSRQHLRIILENNQLVVEDIKSSNGMIVDGKEQIRSVIKDASLITVGPISIRVSTAPIIATLPQDYNEESEPEQTLSYRVDKIEIPNTVTPTPTLNSQQTPMPTKVAVAMARQAAPSHIPNIPSHVPSPNRATYSSGAAAAAQLHHEPAMEAHRLPLHRPAINVEKTHRHNRVVEAHIVWRGVIYDSRLFRQGERIRIGSSKKGLYLPFLRGDFEAARFDGSSLTAQIPENMSGTWRPKGGQPVSLKDLLRSQAHPGKGRNYTLKLETSDLIEMDFGHGAHLHLRYAPAPRQLTKKSMVEPDELLQKTMTGSGIVHLAFLFIALFFAPHTKAPKIKNVPPRLAKLLVEQPKPEPPPPPPPPEEKKPEPPKIVAKEPPKKKEIPKKVPPKPKQVVVKVNPEMKKINKLPEPKFVAKEPPPIPVPPPKKVEELGALAALGAISSPSKTISNQPVAINVNPNAGGQSGTTSGMIGAIKAKGGQLAAGGLSGVKTTGKGFGTGTGYGVAGLQGQAGVRGIAGAVVGTPKLMQIDKTEGLTQKEVMEIVRKHAGKIQQCYERSLLSNPSLAGRVEYEWYITPKGAVEWAKVKRSDISGGDSLNECVANIFRAMKFPVAKNGESTTPSIGFPFGRQ